MQLPSQGRHASAIFFVLFVMCVSRGLAQDDETKKYEDNARNFAFGKINFSMTLDEFKKEFPQALKGQGTNEKIAYYQYSIVDPQKVASGITVWFYDGKLLEIGIVYNKDLDMKLEKIGGAKVLLERLQQKFGNFSPFNFTDDRKKNETKIWWPMPNAGRMIVLIETGFDAKIHVGDTVRQKLLDDRKAKEADIGF